jgi:hypothetical protein
VGAGLSLLLALAVAGAFVRRLSLQTLNCRQRRRREMQPVGFRHEGGRGKEVQRRQTSGARS